jgi:rod shape-determining protein MreC
MNKKYFIYIIVIAILIVVYFRSENRAEPLLSFTDEVKKVYLSSVGGLSNQFNSISFAIDKIYGQAEQYNKLKRTITQLQEYKMLILSASSELNNILSIYQFENFNPSLKVVRVISLANFQDPYKLWIDYSDFNRSKVYGLIHKNSIAGILINKNGRALALLNHDEKCSYTVVIGKNKAPGITKGLSDQDNIVVDYIPEYIDIKIGDEVSTSGLDNIFFSGIKVGKVIKIQKSQGYKQAFVKLYNNDRYLKYLYVIEKAR